MDGQNLDFKIYLVILNQKEKLEPCLKQSSAQDPIENIVSSYNNPNYNLSDLKGSINGVVAIEQMGTREHPSDKYQVLDADYPIIDLHKIHFNPSLNRDKSLDKFDDYRKKDSKKAILLITNSQTIESINEKLAQRKYKIMPLQSSQTAPD